MLYVWVCVCVCGRGDFRIQTWIPVGKWRFRYRCLVLYAVAFVDVCLFVDGADAADVVIVVNMSNAAGCTLYIITLNTTLSFMYYLQPLSVIHKACMHHCIWRKGDSLQFPLSSCYGEAFCLCGDGWALLLQSTRDERVARNVWFCPFGFVCVRVRSGSMESKMSSDMKKWPISPSSRAEVVSQERLGGLVFILSCMGFGLFSVISRVVWTLYVLFYSHTCACTMVLYCTCLFVRVREASAISSVWQVDPLSLVPVPFVQDEWGCT